MADSFSIDDLYGATQAPAASPSLPSKATKPAPSDGSLSLDDLYAPSAHQEVAEHVLNGTWDIAKKTGANLLALGDMVLSLPAQAIGVGGDIGMRAVATARGIDHRTAGIMAETFRNQINSTLGNPLQKLMSVAGFGDDYTNSDAAHAMNWFQAKLEQGGGAIEKATGGALTKEDVGSLANELMLVGGAKGLQGSLGARIADIGKPKVGGVEGGTTDPAQVVAFRAAKDPNAPIAPGELASRDAQQIAALPRATIDETTGVADTARAEETRTARRANARAAFKDDADYTEYLRSSMEIRATEEWDAQAAKAAATAAKPRIRVKLAEENPAADPDAVISPEEQVRASAQPLDLTPEALTVRGAFDGLREPQGAEDNVGRSQRGGVDVDTLTTIAAAGLGIWAGSQLDDKNPLVGGLLGGLAGLGGVKGIGRFAKGARNLISDDPRIRINDLTEGREGEEFRANREVMQFQMGLADDVPKGPDRVQMTKAMEEGWSQNLPGKAAGAATRMENWYTKMDAADPKAAASAAAAYNERVWNPLRNKDANLKAIVGDTDRRIGIKEGKAMGLTPLTEDAAVLAGIYGNAMARTVANRNFIANLRTSTIPGTKIPLASPAAKAPGGYVMVNSPSMQGLLVHPDIAPSVRFLMQAQDPGQVMAGLGAVNTALKRTIVAASLFHAKSLFDAGLAATKNPLTSVKVLAQSAAPRIFGENGMLKMIREGGAGDLVDRAGTSGLKFSIDRNIPGSQDLESSGFYGGMKSLQGRLDDIIPHGGDPLRAIAAINHAFDHFTWNRLHTAMKLEVFAKTTEALLENSAKSGKTLTVAQADAIASDFTNSAFGGINWQRFAEGFTTKVGRDVALRLFSPAGRRVLNQGIFALDWTIATNGNFVRAVSNDLGMGAVRGFLSPKNLGDLHRGNIVRGLMYYGAIGDALNYSMSGHHLWENKDWTRVELGDGRTMQLSKHLLEPFEFMMNPRQGIMNKAAQIPREAGAQVLNQEYLSANGGPPMVPKGTSPGRGAQLRVEHATNAVVPIGVGAFDRQGFGAGTAGMLGVPIYGQTDEQKRTDRLKKALSEYNKRVGNP